MRELQVDKCRLLIEVEMSKRSRKEPADEKEARRKIFKRLCMHVSAGYSLESFEDLSANSVRRYLETYSEEWPREEYEAALRRGRFAWEQIGRKQADGTCLGNSRSWYYNMANRYGWREKIDIEAEHKGRVEVSVISYATQKALQHNESE